MGWWLAWCVVVLLIGGVSGSDGEGSACGLGLGAVW